MISVDICHITKKDARGDTYEYCVIRVNGSEVKFTEGKPLGFFKSTLIKLRIPFDEWDVYIKMDEDYDR